MRIAVIGYGRQGRAAVEYWGEDNEVTVCDSNENLELPDNVDRQLGKDYLKDLDRFHWIIRGPIIHPDDIVAANGKQILKKITTTTEEFIRVCPAPIIGVTGTKGKGTTSSLITKILETAGKKVHLGGNIGIAPLEMLKWKIKPSDWVVLELANFQLIDLGLSPKIAVCLMVVPEHLDWHRDMAEYVGAKQNLFRHQSSKDLAIFNRLSDFSGEVVEVSPALKLSYEVPAVGQNPAEKNGAYVLGEDIYMDDEKVCSISEVNLLGRHNLENVCAAIAATWDLIDNDASVVQRALKDFVGLPHRLERVRSFRDVTFYNDSFAATPEAAVAAMHAIPGDKVMILGGFDRGLDMSVFAKGIQDEPTVKKALLVGQTAPRIADELTKAGFTNFVQLEAKDMQTIVAAGLAATKAGQAVVLSPGCPSFDMFKNFEDRGLQFKKEVDAL
ncbi:UDP-N-acetylmuramoyl-L-alanine--D-glutamate ligase [Candidatus Saccharibacteria bacterium]|nr:MAG: UDP-N-acetylmuramoyl-L-alanine--D-glutamate ligase [Candidatus Saccharibacteria bacterium]